VEQAVVGTADKPEIGSPGATAVDPVVEMVHVAPLRWAVAPWELAVLVG
jgi:hypothetical protein